MDVSSPGQDIYINVKGGVGNQLFQMALGVSLNIEYGLNVKYTYHSYMNDSYQRTFLFDMFNGIAGSVDLWDVSKGGVLISEPFGYEVKDDNPLEKIVTAIGQLPVVLVDGYWQDERYFLRNANYVKSIIRGNDCIGGRISVVAEAIGVHIRRADYGHHGLATAKFYRTAIASIRERKGYLPVIVVTDEPNTAAYMLAGIDNISIVSNAESDPVNDLYLLMQCNHFVIANSTFSWWAAWAAENQGSVIYYPLPWCLYSPNLNPAPKRWNAIGGSISEL